MKMKNNILVSVLIVGVTLGISSQVRAAGKNPETGQGYGAAGCGLGSLVLGDRTGGVQIFAATLNGTFGSQTFGISTGTSNCNPDGKKHASNVKVYVQANQPALANDIARGQGETLASLSQILGCQDPDRLGSVLQRNYSRIFPTETVSSDSVSRSIQRTVRDDRSLSTTCQSS